MFSFRSCSRPATRAVAYLLAEILLRLLSALLAKSEDLPADRVATLQHTIETLVRRLRHLAATGGEQPVAAAEPPPTPTVARRVDRRPPRKRPHPHRPTLVNNILVHPHHRRRRSKQPQSSKF